LKVEEVRNIGVIGAGLMGHEIDSGLRDKMVQVKLSDNDSGVLKSAPERIGNNFQTLLYISTLITPRVVIPAKAGIQEKNWIPGQARNDKLHRIYVVM